MNDPLREAEAHLQRYWNVDGLHEIAVALIFGLTGLWVWATDVSTLPHAWKGAFSMTFPLLILGGMWAEGKAIQALRGRLTYPKVGYVELRKPPRWRLIAAGAVAAVLAALLIVAIKRYTAEELRHAVV